MPKQKILAGFTSVLMVLHQGLLLIPQSRAQISDVPYERTFIVTAYYSPSPDQDLYVTGSYNGDIRLNGGGVHGADGSDVYPGMIAAPGIYPFGTRISCPPYIDGVIHDRGGAIVKAGTRNNEHDRLDFWAGQGQGALETALYWGKRTLTCTVYPPGSDPVKQYVSLPKGNIDGWVKSIAKKMGNNVAYRSPSETIPEKYRRILSDLGYDPDDKASRIAFQLRNNIIASAEDSSAGNVGQQTRSKLDQIAADIKAHLPRENLELGDVDPDVRTLQVLLAQLGYLKEKPTAIFGEKTRQALIKFQIKEGLIDKPDHPAAGFVGPATHNAFAKAAALPYQISSTDQKLIAHLNADKIRATSIAQADALAKVKPESDGPSEDPSAQQLQEMIKSLSQEWVQEHTPADDQAAENNEPAPVIHLASAQTNKSFSKMKEKLTSIVTPFDRSLSLGAKHEDVRKVQQLLQAHGYYKGEQITDYYGEQTRKAVAQFQVASHLVASVNSPGAGSIGPKTVKALNDLYFEEQAFTLPKAITGKIRAPAVHPDDLKSFKQANAPSTNL